MRGFAAIGLVDPKCAANYGGVLRAVNCYGASLVVSSGQRYKRWPKSAADTAKAFRHIPVMHVDNLRDAIPYGAVPVAVDLLEGARMLPDYVHPERAFYIFGPEDGTLGHKITDWCRDIVMVPTNRCMNLSATVNVVLYDRMAKRS